jgi:asparagine synthase (glutamine-hydrolysing)
MTYPEWLDAGFAERCGCRGRWNAISQPAPTEHPIRPRGHASFSSPNWQSLFDECDVQGATVGTEMRFPFFDLRLLRYMLALPVMPWCRAKLIIRRAMAPVLPRAVIERKKSTPRSRPDLARANAVGLPRLVPSPILSRYVNAGKVPVAAGTIPELRSVLRPLGLNYWLQNLTGSPTRGARS